MAAQVLAKIMSRHVKKHPGAGLVVVRAKCKTHARKDRCNYHRNKCDHMVCTGMLRGILSASTESESAARISTGDHDFFPIVIGQRNILECVTCGFLY